MAKKSFHFTRATYKSQFLSEAYEGGAALPHLMMWRGGFGDRTIHNAASTQHTVHYDSSKSKLVTEEMKAGKDGPASISGPFAFAGLEDTYFAGVVLSPPGVVVELQTWQDTVLGVPDLLRRRPHVGAAVGGKGRNRYNVFVGPKDFDVLRAADPKLEELVDFGRFWFLAKPLFLALNWSRENLIPN